MQFELRCIQLKLIACFIISADNFRYFGAQQVCCLVARLCLSLGKSRRGANRMTGKALHMKGLLKRYISGGWDPWGINKKCLKILCSVFLLFSWRREPEKKRQPRNRCSLAALPGSGSRLRAPAGSPPAACHEGQWLWAPPSAPCGLSPWRSLSCRSCAPTGAPRWPEAERRYDHHDTNSSTKSKSGKRGAGTRQRMMRNRHLDQHPTPQTPPFCYFTLWLFPTLFHVFSNIILRPSGRSCNVNSHESAIKDIKS